MRRTSSKAAWAGIGLFLLGVIFLMFAEVTAVPGPFSPSIRPWNNWHYVTIGLLTLSAALFVVWYRLDGRDD